MRTLLSPALSLLALSFGCATTATERLGAPPLTTVDHVDLERYLGTWHEIASFPQRFQKGCTATTANYAMSDDGSYIVVTNRCHLGSPDGKLKEAHGRAKVVDPTTNAKLKVSFFRPFWGDYWIVDLDPEYRFAVVGSPSRDYLWILAREPKLDEATYAGILARLKAQRYEVERLQTTVQRER